MCDFKPGDEVVCVDDTGYPPIYRPDECPVLGKHYRVVSMSYHDDGLCWRGAGVSVSLAEIELPHWAAERFRKVQRRDLSAWLATENTIEEPRRAKESQNAPAA